MTAFTFDAKAALELAQNRQVAPIPPNLPNLSASGEAGLGGLGRLGTVRASEPVMTPEELASDLYQERAAIREFDGGQTRLEAETGALIDVAQCLRTESETLRRTWLDQACEG